MTHSSKNNQHADEDLLFPIPPRILCRTSLSSLVIMKKNNRKNKRKVKKSATPVQSIPGTALTSCGNSPLLQLPAEVRLIIYGHLFYGQQIVNVAEQRILYDDFNHYYSRETDNECHDGILRTCHLIRSETFKLFYQNCHFVMVSHLNRPWRAIEALVRKPSTINTNFIRKISLRATKGNYGYDILGLNNHYLDILGFNLHPEGLLYVKDCVRFLPGLRELRYVYDSVTERHFFNLQSLRTGIRKMSCQAFNEELAAFYNIVTFLIEVRNVVPQATMKSADRFLGSWISQPLGRGEPLVIFSPLNE